MDETLAFLTIGFCFIAGASVLIALHWRHEWKHSDRRAHDEYWRFRWYMNELDIDRESMIEAMKKIKTFDELISTNNRLQKCVNHER